MRKILFYFLWNYYTEKISCLTRMHFLCPCPSFAFPSAAFYCRSVEIYLHQLKSNDFRWHSRSPFSYIVFIRSSFPSLHLFRSPISFIESEDERERWTDREKKHERINARINGKDKRLDLSKKKRKKNPFLILGLKIDFHGFCKYRIFNFRKSHF